MNEPKVDIQLVLTYSVINLVLYLLGFTGEIVFFIGWLLGTTIQGLVGFIYLLRKERRLTGMVLLIIALVMFLVGMSICSQVVKI